MRRTLLRWLAPLLVGACAWVSPAAAQPATPQPESAPSGDTSALPYAVAALCTLLVLVIVCTPTRKGWKG